MGRQNQRRSTKQTIKGVPMGTLIVSQPLSELSPAEGRLWLDSLRTRLLAKQQREQDYLDRRAKRGVHTTTDDVYEADQQLENELLALLDQVSAWVDARQGGT
jgi:hypothetical protein